MTASPPPASFRLAYVPGVTPTKWVRIWDERMPGIPLTLVPVTAAEAPALLRDAGADAGFVRLPVDRTYFSAIPLYTETTVVVLPKDHLFTAADEVTADDLADDIVLHPLDEVLAWERRPGLPAKERPATTADAIELVAAGVGLLVVPQSLARLHHRKDLTYRPVIEVPESQVALAWPEERTTDRVEDFIGIVRGRTVNSSRGRRASPAGQEGQRDKHTDQQGNNAQRRTGSGHGPGSGKNAARRKPAPGRNPRRGAPGGAKGAKGAKGPQRGKRRR